MMPRAPSVVATGAANASAKARTSGPAWDTAAASPATIATRRAAVRIAAARSMSRASATGRCTGIARASVSMVVDSWV